MSSGPDLFVVCKNCGSQASPYVTECPYCGKRLRKRAPKLDREGQITPPKPKRARRTSLGPLRRGELPGIRPDALPYATFTLILAAILVSIAWKSGAVGFSEIVILGPPNGQWWRLVSAPFAYDSAGYQLAALGAVAIFGWLIERRSGSAAVVAVALAGAVAGMALAAFVGPAELSAGGNGMALALLAAWAVPDLRLLYRSQESDSDLLGAAVVAAVVAVMPLAAPEASWLAALGGAGAGLLLGLALAKRQGRRVGG
ncbi:MAG: zinc ribbon domain-containing protein [Solirubrobacterales bacterium]|nr:zinc ribbon domain-containing protein [Solirubrobacterales bacterium]